MNKLAAAKRARWQRQRQAQRRHLAPPRQLGDLNLVRPAFFFAAAAALGLWLYSRRQSEPADGIADYGQTNLYYHSGKEQWIGPADPAWSRWGHTSFWSRHGGPPPAGSFVPR